MYAPGPRNGGPALPTASTRLLPVRFSTIRCIPSPANKGRNMLVIAQSTIPLTKSVGRVSNSSAFSGPMRKSACVPRPACPAVLKIRQCPPSMQQFAPVPNPSEKNPPRKTAYFPRVIQKPPCPRYLKCAKNPRRKTVQKISKSRKTPCKTALAPQKCSTIHPQQFPRDPVNSGPSRPHIVQKVSPKMSNNSNHYCSFPNSSLGTLAPPRYPDHNSNVKE
jgi:hypothetical protein